MGNPIRIPLSVHQQAWLARNAQLQQSIQQERSVFVAAVVASQMDVASLGPQSGATVDVQATEVVITLPPIGIVRDEAVGE